MIALEALRKLLLETEENYRHLHQHPELGLTEYATAAFIAQKLRAYGMDVTEGVVRTGVIGVLRGEGCAGTGRTIAIRSDMDALPIQEETGLDWASKTPGIMHACGHDAHMAMLLGAARYLSENRKDWSGTVKFIFQPAEEDYAPGIEPPGEVPGGAWYIVRDGWLNDVDMCFAIHVDPLLETGRLAVHAREAMASTDLFRLTVQGKGGHGAMPQDAIDPLPALADMLSALYALPGREFSPLDAVVLTVGEVHTSSSAWNAIPDRVTCSGTFRTYDTDIRATINRRIPEIAEKIAEAHRCRAFYEREPGYDPTVNDAKAAAHVVSVARACLGAEKVDDNPKPQCGGEDAGVYFQAVPGALMFLGCRKPGDISAFGLHHPKMLPDRNALSYGILMHVNCVLSLCGE